jgi:cytochrome b subunit of formate dehydrogenase
LSHINRRQVALTRIGRHSRLRGWIPIRRADDKKHKGVSGMKQRKLRSTSPAAVGVFRSIAVAFAALLFAAPWTPATAQPAAAASSAAAASAPAPALKEKCQGCHADPTVKSEAGKTMAVSPDDYARSAHRKVDCAACHTNPQGIKHPKEPLGAVSPQVCQECHSDEFKAIATSIHGKRSTGAKAIKDCTSCHDSLHKVLKGGDPASSLSPVNQIKTCGGCHEEMMAGYERSEHAHALLKSGLVGSSPSCSSCHGTHDIHPKSEPAATTSHAKSPETCGTCHKAVLAQWKDSSHGGVWKKSLDGRPAATAEGPVCVTCHEPHAIKRTDTPVVRKEVADRCGTCHEKFLATFHDSFHGQSATLKNAKAAVCADCHTPHANFPASDPRSSVHPANLAKTCGACHANANASFLTFDPHADPKDPKRNPYVYWVWMGMTALLLGVFGFFGLHDLLWLQRALVGKWRGEFGPAPAKTQYVRRFSTMQVAMHITVVTSFLLLAATGLPLKFAQAPWAAPLMAVFGPQTASILHRIAAIVTFGYFAWHLGVLAYGWIVKKERGYFWGPRSMVPQPRDLLDLWAMLKFFFYVGPRPKFDRFTYWEKFDYMGVFWGVAVIGISGLVLWLPTLATMVLPGWALNAAYVIHSDEALLATGFIFLFHFFHTHLRPESFPMDTVVFTGRMPLATLEEERPLEYERLVADGKLEGRLTPPPSQGALWLAYVFGFAAVAIGIVLAVFIFWALLGGFMH